MIRLISLLAITACAALFAADPAAEKPMPEQAKSIVAKYEAAIQAAADKARKDLLAAADTAGRQGKLDLALAIKQIADEPRFKPVEKPQPEPLIAAPGPNAREKVAGRYTITTEGGWSGVFSLRATGECLTPGNRGTWKLQGRKVTCNWDNGATDWFTLTSDTEGEGKDKADGWLRARKVEDK